MEKDVKRIYLDYNATTPLDEEVIDTITNALKNAWGNPSSSYGAGVKAKEVISNAREEVAAAINAKPLNIIFTSGGTESNNWVIQTAIQHFNANREHAHIKPHIISTTVEHDSVTLPLLSLCSSQEIDLTLVPINPQKGYVTPQDIIAELRENTCLVTVMMANNETGTIMPIQEIGRALNTQSHICGQRPLFHTDAAQALGKIPVDVEELGVDYLTLVGHKFYGPRIGALYIRGLDEGTTPLYPLFQGGGQERNYRPGTENTPMIAGLGKAAHICQTKLKEISQQMALTRDYLEERLKKELGERVVFNCSSAPRLPNTCSVAFAGKDMQGYELLKRIQGFSCSAGSACHSGSLTTSKVLLNFHIPLAQAGNTIRISTGRSTSREDIDRVVEELVTLVLEK